MAKINKIAFGGSCDRCTEAVFKSLKGFHLVNLGALQKTYGTIIPAIRSNLSAKRK